jgi:lipopolysaccharide export system permease protein
MLTLLHRHILREILVSTLLAMGLFIFVLLMGNALKDIVELVVAGQLEWLLLIKLIALLIPYVAAYALPLGMLTGTLMALGRLSAQNEITALKSAGLGLYQIAAPVFLIASLGVVAGIMVNLHYAPKSRTAYKQLMATAVSENPVSFIEARRFINEFPGAVIYTGSREGKRLEDVWFWKLDAQKRVELFIRGREGRVDFREDDNTLVLTLLDGTTEKRDPDAPEQFGGMSLDMLDFGELPFEWSLDEVFGRPSAERVKVKYMTFSQLLDLRESALEAEAGAGLSTERLQAQFHLQKNFRPRIFSHLSDDLRGAACRESRAQRKLCEPGNRLGRRDEFLLSTHCGELVRAKCHVASGFVDLAAEYPFPSDWLVFVATRQSALSQR